MDLKSKCKDLLNEGFKVINDLTVNSDMTQRRKVLLRNKRLAKCNAKQLTRGLHELLDTFDNNLQILIDCVVEEKSQILESHSEEIIQVVDYVSKLCNMAENLIQDGSSQFSDCFARELNSEFQKSLKDYNELKLVDYETFTSVELEVQLSELMHTSFVNIVSWNSQHTKKELLHSLCFEDLKKRPGGEISKEDVCKEMALDKQATGTTILSNNEVCNGSSNRNNNHSARRISPSHKPGKLLMTVVESPEEEISCANIKEEIITPDKNFDKMEQMNMTLFHPQKSTKQADKQSNSQSFSCPSHACSSDGFDYSFKLLQGIAPKDPINASPSQLDDLTNILQQYQAMDLNTGKDQSLMKETSQVSDTKISGSLSSCARQDHGQYRDPCQQSSPLQEHSKSKPQIVDAGKRREMKSSDTEGQLSIASGCETVTERPKKTTEQETTQKIAKPEQETVEQAVCYDQNILNDPDEDIEMEKIKTAVESYLNISQAESPVSTITNQYNRNKVKSQIPEKETGMSSHLGKLSKPKGVVKSTINVPAAGPSVAGHKEKTKSKDENSWTIPQPINMEFDLRSVVRATDRGVPEIKARLVKMFSAVNGGMNTSFDHPTGLTVTSNGLLVVTDTGNNLVKILNDGDLVLTIGGNDGVKFVRPSAVVCDDQNNIYVKDDVCIQIFDSCGNLLKMVGQKVLKRPYGLALVRCFSDSCLVFVDEYKQCPSLGRYWIKGDNLDCCRYQPLQQYRSNYSKVRFLATYQDIMLASDLGASIMYLCDLHGKTLQAFGRYGNLPGEFREPSGITVDAVGNWMVADSRNNRIQVFTNNGNFLAMLNLSTGIRRPSGIHLTSDGHLYVINYLDSLVKVFELYR